MNKGAKIAIVLVVIVIGIVAVGAIAVANTVVSPHGEYTAEIHFENQLVTRGDYPTILKPSDGNIFLWADITMKNNDWSSGISNNTFYWNASANGLSVVHDAATYSVKTDNPHVLTEIEKGASGTWTYIFQVPSTTDINDVQMKWIGSPVIEGKTVAKS